MLQYMLVEICIKKHRHQLKLQFLVYSINTNDANGNGNAYDELFLADNNTNGAQNEFIFAVQFMV